MAELLVIVPARTRTWNIERMLKAWTDTGAWGVADLCVEVDADDPNLPGYQAIPFPEGARLTVHDTWMPCMHKADIAARREADSYFAIGFMGDDHAPETPGWATRFEATLRELGTGIVYGRDGIQDERLPTYWLMTADVVRALGRVCPSPVEHLFSDNAVLDLGVVAGCIRYDNTIMVRHNHYIAGWAPKDEQYERVNSSDQWSRDEAAYLRWRDGGGLAADAATVRALRQH